MDIVKPIPPSIPAPKIVDHFKSRGKVQIPKLTARNENNQIPNGLPITNQAMIPMVFDCVKPSCQFGFIAMHVLAIANKGKMKKATGLCRKCCNLYEIVFLPPSPNGITNANKTPVIVA